MFWILKKSRLTSTAVSFFNSINNNVVQSANTGGYNKLCGTEETETICNNYEKKVENVWNMAEVESDSGGSRSEIEFEEELSQDSDYEENLTCNVCDRFFCSQSQLSRHQKKKRHFGCSSCDSLFSSLMALEHHKEEFEHWSGSDVGPMSDESDQEPSSHEMERLL
ncbi:uncharacterized protein LOC106665902 [Cimex lectularius]|uniref:C2H2-type domain-containing protein n=1 Tax=Cimex lectularius TaxID=79782 RepID=A0A8I6TDZ2_CIMLE|nr:uncharacterized protein LOC106665902 [Cimex lectularius]